MHPALCAANLPSSCTQDVWHRRHRQPREAPGPSAVAMPARPPGHRRRSAPFMHPSQWARGRKHLRLLQRRSRVDFNPAWPRDLRLAALALRLSGACSLLAASAAGWLPWFMRFLPPLRTSGDLGDIACTAIRRAPERGGADNGAESSRLAPGIFAVPWALPSVAAR